MSIIRCADCQRMIDTDYTIPHTGENGDQLCEGCYIDRETDADQGRRRDE